MDFQTPPYVCDYMVNITPYSINPIYSRNRKILEPTPGQGNIVSSLHKYLPHSEIIAPENFWDIPNTEQFDLIVMNPPFTPMEEGYKILFRCMEMSDNIIALMPWLTMINSEKRTKLIMDFGLKSITHLPRNVFKGSRVQCCILEMKKGYTQDTIFKNFKTK